MANKGGRRFCPNCKKLVETRVLGYGAYIEKDSGELAKKRKIICGTDSDGTGGCGCVWYTEESVEKLVSCAKMP